MRRTLFCFAAFAALLIGATAVAAAVTDAQSPAVPLPPDPPPLVSPGVAPQPPGLQAAQPAGPSVSPDHIGTAIEAAALDNRLAEAKRSLSEQARTLEEKAKGAGDRGSARRLAVVTLSKAVPLTAQEEIIPPEAIAVTAVLDLPDGRPLVYTAPRGDDMAAALLSVLETTPADPTQGGSLSAVTGLADRDAVLDTAVIVGYALNLEDALTQEFPLRSSPAIAVIEVAMSLSQQPIYEVALDRMPTPGPTTDEPDRATSSATTIPPTSSTEGD